jgi:hypothetical protein
MPDWGPGRWILEGLFGTPAGTIFLLVALFGLWVGASHLLDAVRRNTCRYCKHFDYPRCRAYPESGQFLTGPGSRCHLHERV